LLHCQQLYNMFVVFCICDEKAFQLISTNTMSVSARTKTFKVNTSTTLKMSFTKAQHLTCLSCLLKMTELTFLLHCLQPYNVFFFVFRICNERAFQLISTKTMSVSARTKTFKVDTSTTSKCL
jgi:hypothetical protein